ncbi:MAG: penicillin-binding protein activator [Aquimonas sp.]|nr:penicillin-binding protein activator [Aquimonas sp.]
MIRFRSLALALLTTLTLVACDSTPTRSGGGEALTAERLYADGDFPAAAQAFVDAASRSRSQRDALTLRAAEAWREDGRIERAAPLLGQIDSRRLGPDEALRLDLLRAELALVENRPADALALLARPADRVPPALRDRLLFLRAQAHAGVDRPFEAARDRAALGSLLPAAEQAENDAAIRSLLGQLSPAELQRAAAVLSREEALYPVVAAELSALGLAMPSGLSGGVLDRGGQRAQRVALLLPRSGTFAAAGEAVRDGFLSGYFADPGERPELTFYDAGDSVETALAAYRAAAADGAQRVVGPLSREAVAALFEQGALRVPVLALNRGTSTPPPGSQSFALSPEDEGIEAARRMLALGYRRLMLAAGTDEHSRRVLAALVPAYTRGGGQIVAEMNLSGAGPDYSNQIRAAIRAAGSRSAAEAPATAGQRESRRDTSVYVEVDAIYIAVRYEQARLLVPQLRAAGIFDRPLLASSQIRPPESAARPDRDFDGIEFTELPWLLGAMPPTPGLPSAQDSRRLASSQGQSARLFAFGIDAYRVLAALPALSRLPGTAIDGASGTLRLDDFGQVLRAPAWGRFAGARVQPVDGFEGGFGDGALD